MPSSYWFHAVPDERRFSVLSGDVFTDVAILGGGIAGVSAAYFLSRAGVNVALVESGHLLTGDTGYTTGFIMHFLDNGSSTGLSYHASDRAFDLYPEVIVRERIECDFEEVPTYGFTQKDDISDLRSKFENFYSLDSSLEFFYGDNAVKLTGFPVSAAFRKPRKEGQFHVRKFFIPLTLKAQSSGAQIFEESEVIEFQRNADFHSHKDSAALIRLVTKDGSVTCRKLIVASGSPSRRFFPIAGESLTGAISFVLEVKFLSGIPFSRGLFFDDLNPFHYFRRVDDCTAIFGGEDRLMKGLRPATSPYIALEDFVRKNSGNVPFDVTNKWQGAIFYTPDYLPFIGSHSSYGPNIFFATGFGGNGMTFGFLAGEILADLITGRENEFAKLFSFGRA